MRRSKRECGRWSVIRGRSNGFEWQWLRRAAVQSYFCKGSTRRAQQFVSLSLRRWSCLISTKTGTKCLLSVDSKCLARLLFFFLRISSFSSSNLLSSIRGRISPVTRTIIMFLLPEVERIPQVLRYSKFGLMVFRSFMLHKRAPKDRGIIIIYYYHNFLSTVTTLSCNHTE